MHPLLRYGERLLNPVENVLISVASAALFGMVLIVSADVVMRYAFNDPLGWSFDVVTRYLVPIAFFLAVSQAMRFNEHVRVDIVASRLPPRLRNAILALTLLATFVVLGLVFWQGCLTVAEAWKNHEETPIGSVQWPTWTSLVIMPAGVLLLSLRVLLHIAGHLARALDPAAPVPAGIDEADPLVEEAL